MPCPNQAALEKTRPTSQQEKRCSRFEREFFRNSCYSWQSISKVSEVTTAVFRTVCNGAEVIMCWSGKEKAVAAEVVSQPQLHEKEQLHQQPIARFPVHSKVQNNQKWCRRYEKLLLLVLVIFWAPIFGQNKASWKGRLSPRKSIHHSGCTTTALYKN
jgi:hypothetical protein